MPADARAHLDEQLGKVDDLRFARGVLQHGLPLGKYRGHHKILRAGDSHHIGADHGALQAAGARHDIAVLDVDIGAQRGQALDMLVDRALPDRAAAWQAHARLAKARDQRPEHQDRRAHGLDELVRRLECAELIGGDGDAVVRVAHGAHAHVAQQLERGGDVVEPGHVGQAQGIRSEQSRAEDRQRGVLRAGDADLAAQRRAAHDTQLVH